MSKILSHDEAVDGLCNCAMTVTLLSYEEVIKGYFSLRGWPDPETMGELYAAAPGLLAVCQEYLGCLGPGGYHPHPGAPATARMRAAVAKATGVA